MAARRAKNSFANKLLQPPKGKTSVGKLIFYGVVTIVLFLFSAWLLSIIFPCLIVCWMLEFFDRGTKFFSDLLPKD